MEILGYLGAILMGITLGLIGGGGSILTLPLLVYFLKVDAVLATSYSLFVVGFTSLLGSYPYIKNKQVHFKGALIFGVPSVLAVFLTRKFIVPSLPEKIIEINNFVLTKPLALLLLFAIIMLVASYYMIKKCEDCADSDQEMKYNYPAILAEGLVVGTITGLVGAGGGFLIIPALVILAKMPMKKAIGTSLLIIAAKSLIGFLGDISTGLPIDWKLLGIFSFLSTIGIFLGSYWSKHFSNDKLKPIFGITVLIMGTFIIIKELYNLFS